MPIWKTQVHNHESEVVCESVGDEEPLTREILGPDLRLSLWVFENESQTTVLDLLVYLESTDRFLAEK